MYSSHDNCVGYELYTKKVKKPIYNLYSEYKICEDPVLENYKYCKKFTDVDYKLTREQFYENVYSYMNKVNESNKENSVAEEKNFIEKNYLYLIGGAIIFIIGITTIVIIRKKKSSL